MSPKAEHISNIFSSGVVVISDTMGSELDGSRQLMTIIAESGDHIIKPMLFE